MSGFGEIEKKADRFQYCIEKYAIFYTTSRSFGGMLKGIEDGWLVLQPFQGVVYDVEKGLIRKIINEPMKIRKDDIIGIEPTTEQDLRNYCEYSNKHPEKDAEKKEKEEKESK
ncbi:hypothetical protein HYT92_00285 [Candidatus Pacearchaeota archaeon]|nr:hypothetical protein [Candidatus Pacearchaeota archaeon]